MNDDTLVYLAFGAIGLFLGLLILAAFYRWVFSIKRQLWNQKMQIELLIIIAERLGANTSDDDFTKLKETNRGITDLY